MNIAQEKIRPKIVTYLRIRRRSSKLIEQFSEGYCNGFVILGLYGSYLESLQVPHQSYPPQDDWAWFEGTLQLLSDWNGEWASLTAHNIKAIERLIGLIEFFQHVDKYLSIGQSNLPLLFSDTKNRQLKREYSIAGLFTAVHLTSLLKEILKYSQRLILISVLKHTTFLFRHRETIFFYNPNNEKGRLAFNKKNLMKIANTIFKAYNRYYTPDKPSPFGFRLFTFDRFIQPYTSQFNLLKQLDSPLSAIDKNYGRGLSGLHMAAAIGCVESLRYYLQHGVNVDEPNVKNKTALHYAIDRQQIAAAKLLVDHGADIHFKNLDGQSPLVAAADNIDKLVVLLDNKRNASFANLVAALTYAKIDLRSTLLDTLSQKTLAKMFGPLQAREKKLAYFKAHKKMDDDVYQLLKEKMQHFSLAGTEPLYGRDIFCFYQQPRKHFTIADTKPETGVASPQATRNWGRGTW